MFRFLFRWKRRLFIYCAFFKIYLETYRFFFWWFLLMNLIFIKSWKCPRQTFNALQFDRSQPSGVLIWTLLNLRLGLWRGTHTHTHSDLCPVFMAHSLTGVCLIDDFWTCDLSALRPRCAFPVPGVCVWTGCSCRTRCCGRPATGARFATRIWASRWSWLCGSTLERCPAGQTSGLLAKILLSLCFVFYYNFKKWNELQVLNWFKWISLLPVFMLS